MYIRLLLFLSFLLLNFGLYSQDLDPQSYRTYDGTSNNLDNTDWGAAGINLLRATEIGYADSVSSVGGVSRPNPRIISNELFAQNSLLNDPLNLSDYCWVWSQFIDHDIGITPDLHIEDITIDVPMGDPWFDPLGMGSAVIPMARSISDPSSGTDANNPRQHPNEITAFIDGSGVYGSDEERANWLRTFSDGKLKTSEGNLLPFNTLTGEFDDDIDPNAPGMDNPVGITDKVFVAGDVRANENVLLLSFHTLFVREHNRICDELVVAYPDWTDEEIYQHARKMVGGIIQNIVYGEWLPAMGVDIDAYNGYQSDVNPGLFNVFTAAAFRMGHTLLNSEIRRVDDQGEPLVGVLNLRDAFFNPMVVVNTGGVEPFLKGMAEQVQQDMDNKVIDDVRNFLFGSPGAGGLDLASLNIKRGRERGLPDFNSVRQSFGLEPYSFYGEINSDASVFIPILTLYSSVDDIDPWVGMLAEAHMYGTLFGPTVMKIMEVQFTNLRDGDRFYFQNDPILSPNEKEDILETTFHDVIMRNTGITLMQDSVFKAMPHEEICGNMTSDIVGQVYTEEGLNVADVQLEIVVAGAQNQANTDDQGSYEVADLESCSFETLSISKEEDYGNGVSTLDMVLLQQHILGVATLSSPYKMLAADVNNSGSLSTLDLIEMRKLILTIQDSFSNSPSWRFVPADYVFQNETNPFDESYQEFMNYEILPSQLVQNFIAIKMGDLNGSAETGAAFQAPVDEREPQALQFFTTDMSLVEGQTYEIGFTASQIENIAGFQFSMAYNPANLNLNQLGNKKVDVISTDNFAFFKEEGLITAAWNTNGINNLEQEENDIVFSFSFTALKNSQLSKALSISSERTKAKAYSSDFEAMPLDLVFAADTNQDEFALYQNQPNPFVDETTIPFYLPESGLVRLSIFDVSGKLLYTAKQSFDEGYKNWTISSNYIAENGLIYYRLDTENGTATRKMVLSR